MYKQIKSLLEPSKIVCVEQLEQRLFIPFDPSNTDCANFKREINEDNAELQDADGNVMSPEAAKAFVATLP